MTRSRTFVPPFLLAVPLVVACGGGTDAGGGSGGGSADPSPPASAFVGTWGLDAEATIAAMLAAERAEPGSETSEENLDTMAELMRQMYAEFQFTLDVNADHTFAVDIAGPDPQAVRGAWSLSGASIELTPDGEQEGPMRGELVDGALHVDDPEMPGRDLVFARG